MSDLPNLARSLPWHSSRKLTPAQIRNRTGCLDSNDRPSPGLETMQRFTWLNYTSSKCRRVNLSSCFWTASAFLCSPPAESAWAAVARWASSRTRGLAALRLSTSMRLGHQWVWPPSESPGRPASRCSSSFVVVRGQRVSIMIVGM